MRTGTLTYRLGSLPPVKAAEVTEVHARQYRQQNNLNLEDINTDNWMHNTLNEKMLEIVKSSPELKAASWSMDITGGNNNGINF